MNHAWTDKLPTESGWYWFSRLSWDSGDRIPPRMVEVLTVGPKFRLMVVIDGAVCFDLNKRPDQPSGRPHGCLWVGPLGCPELPT